MYELPFLLEYAPPSNKRRIWDKKVNKRSPRIKQRGLDGALIRGGHLHLSIPLNWSILNVKEMDNHIPVAWTVNVGETCPTGEESDGEEVGDAPGEMDAVEDGEGLSERGAEVEFTDWVDFTGGIGVVIATTDEDNLLLAWTDEAMDRLESTETIGGERLGAVKVGWLLIVTVALDNTVWKWVKYVRYFLRVFARETLFLTKMFFFRLSATTFV